MKAGPWAGSHGEIRTKEHLLGHQEAVAVPSLLWARTSALAFLHLVCLLTLYHLS